MDAAAKKVRIIALEAGAKFTIVQFPDEAPKYDLTYSVEGIGDNNIVKAIDPTTGELTQGDVGSGDDIAAIKAHTADITVKVTAEAVGPYPALQDTTLFTVEHYRWMRVAAGRNHTLAINNRGELYAWGANDNGQLRIGTVIPRGESELTPQRVGSDSDWDAISGGKDHSLALKSDRTLYSWGANSFGQLGNGENGADFGDKSKDKTAPIRIGTDRDWRTISAGNLHSLALKSDNTLHTWGINEDEQLGLGDYSNRDSPAKVGSAADWKAVDGGRHFSFALKDNGALYAWGYSELLGIGTDTSQTKESPTPVPHP